MCNGSGAKQPLQTVEQKWPGDGACMVKPFSNMAKIKPPKMGGGWSFWTCVDARLAEIVIKHALNGKREGGVQVPSRS